MEGIVTLPLLAGVLSVSIGIGVALEIVLFKGMFRLLTKFASTQFSGTPRSLFGPRT